MGRYLVLIVHTFLTLILGGSIGVVLIGLFNNKGLQDLAIPVLFFGVSLVALVLNSTKGLVK